jgi:hypothetical protein
MQAQFVEALRYNRNVACSMLDGVIVIFDLILTAAL